MKKIFLSLLLVAAVLLPAFAKEEVIQKTQLEKRQMQTREYNTSDKTMVMKAMLNVLQDDGFIINNANPLLGCITAIKEYDGRTNNDEISREFGMTSMGVKFSGISSVVVDANANVTDFGGSVRVRMTFKMKLLNAYASVSKVNDVESPEYYKNFFAKVDKAIYLQKQKI